MSYYEAEQPGLGEHFWCDLNQHLEWIVHHSTIPRLRVGDYHRVNLKVFPFYVAYTIREDSVLVLAISHAARKPHHWIDRKPE